VDLLGRAATNLDRAFTAPSHHGDRPDCSSFPRIRQALAPLRVRPFGRLLTSYTVNSIGDSVGIVALAVLVYAETKDPLATTALFLTAEFLPAFIAPAVTARVDQLALRRVLPLIYVIEAVLFGLMAFVATEFALILILVLTFLDGIFMLTARGLTRSALNEVLGPEDLLREGNGLINVGFALSSVGGAALGGLLVELMGVSRRSPSTPRRSP
jgi:predicted MFS family arabinose efflux permease